MTFWLLNTVGTLALLRAVSNRTPKGWIAWFALLLLPGLYLSRVQYLAGCPSLLGDCYGPAIPYYHVVTKDLFFLLSWASWLVAGTAALVRLARSVRAGRPGRQEKAQSGGGRDGR